MTKHEKALRQLVNRLRTTANVLEKEAKLTGDALNSARAHALREVAKHASAWVVEDRP